MHGKFLKSVLEKENVDTKGMLLDENYFTTLAFVEVSETGERTFSFARKPGADTKIQKEEVDVDVLDHTHIFHVGSLSLTDQPARDTTFYAVKRAKNKGSVISYDPNYRASLWPDEKTAKKHMRSLVPYVDLMKISDEETELLTDHKDVREAAEALYSQGVKLWQLHLAAKELSLRQGWRLYGTGICSETDRRHERSRRFFLGRFPVQSQHSRETSGRADPGGSEGICPFRQCSGQSLRGEKRCDPGNAGACTGGTQNCKVIVFIKL